MLPKCIKKNRKEFEALLRKNRCLTKYIKYIKAACGTCKRCQRSRQPDYYLLRAFDWDETGYFTLWAQLSREWNDSL